MTKDDKQFFTGLVQGLETKFDGLESKVDKIDARLAGVESGQGGILSRLAGVESGQMTLVSAIQELDTRLTGEIRHNGVLIEKMQGDIDLIVEGHQAFHQRIGRLEATAA